MKINVLLMRRHNQRVYRVARAVLKDETEAEDAMQQAYINAFRHLDQFEERAQFSTWLTRITVHEALARLRQRQIQAAAAAEGERDGERMEKLVAREPSKTDERQRFLSLTAKGRRTFRPLDERSSRDVAAMIDAVAPRERHQLVQAVETVRRLLGDKTDLPRTPYLLRLHQPGDMGWIVYRQAILYTEEYGWDGTYEALAAEIVASFLKSYDPKWERAWVAEKEGERVGAVFVAKASDEIAKLRLLHVEPEARGLGIGKRLV